MESSYETKLRLKVMKRGQLLRSVSIFGMAFAIYSLISVLSGPTMIENQSVTVQHCYSGSMCFEPENENAIWRGRVNNIDLENQAISLRMIPQSPEKLAFSLNISLSIEGVEDEIATEGDKIDTNAKDCHIKCHSAICSECNLFYLPIIEHNSYIVELTFLNAIPEEITSIKFEWSFINPDFTVYQLAVKYFVFSLSVVSLVVYLLSLRAVASRNWSLKYKSMVVLSVSLVIFNEPLFVLNIYEPSEAMFMISAFCINQFFFIILGCTCLLLIQEALKGRWTVWPYVVGGIVLTAIFSGIVIFYAESDLENRYGLRYFSYFTNCFSIIIFLFESFCFLLFFAYICCIKDIEYCFISVYCYGFLPIFTIYALLSGIVRPSSGFFGYSIFVISEYNFIVYFLAYCYAPKQISVVNFQKFSELGQDFEENAEDKSDSDIIQEATETEDVKITN